MPTRRLVVLLLAVPLALALTSAPGRAQADDQDDVVVAILDVMKARGIIDQAQYDEMLAMARARARRDADQIGLIEGNLARLRAPDVQVEGGQPGKLAFRSPDGKWSAQLRGFILTRFADIDSQVDGQSGNNFSVPAARLTLAGNSGGENIRYKLEIDASTNTSLDTDASGSDKKSASLKDAYVDYGVTEDGSVYFGQYKFPFGREQLIPDTALEFADRSLASQTYTPGREPGASWQGHGADGLFEYELAASNGNGEGEPNTSDNSALQTGDGLRYGGRLVWYPLGPMNYSMPAFQTLEGGTRLAIGAGYMTDKDARLLNSSAPGTAGMDADTLDLECQLLTGPLSLLAEYYDRSTNVPGAPDVDDHGYTLQAGWFLVPNQWEIAARLSMVDEADVPASWLSSPNLPGRWRQTSLGINRYVDRNNGKWVLNWVDLDNESVSGQDQTTIELQYQIMF